MAKVRGEGSVKRLGSRYGRKVRAKLQQVECEQKKQNKCPYCLYKKLRRLSKGIYFCEKCKSKFTGRAYNITKEIRIKEEVKPEELLEEQPQEEEGYEESPKRGKGKKAGKKHVPESEEVEHLSLEEPSGEPSGEPEEDSQSSGSSEGYQDSEEFGEEIK
jgi:ribosomal protein L37AE/L43A